MIIYMNIKINTMTLLNKQITSKQDIKDFIDYLAANNMLYHFEDDAKDIYSCSSGFEERAFTDEQCVLLDQRTTEMLRVDHEYSFDYVLETYLND
jgi:ubiquinone/menaquinone biosynthesis C-methylase UbiE